MNNHAWGARPAAPSFGTRLGLLVTAGLLAGTVLAAVPAYAQTTLSSAQVTQLKRLTVTATRRAAQVLDVPASVSVVSAEDLEKRVVRDIQDLVRYQPGVSVDRQTAVTNPF